MISKTDPTKTDEIKISTFLWMLHEGPEKLTNDRVSRFQANKEFEEWTPASMLEHEIILAKESITLGDIVTVIDIEKKMFLVGTVIKFKKSGTVRKKDRVFKFSSLFLSENSNVEFMIFPVYRIIRQNVLLPQTGRSKFYKTSAYINTINSAYIDFHSEKIDERLTACFNFE
jgi:hypothetical protein